MQRSISYRVIFVIWSACIGDCPLEKEALQSIEYGFSGKLERQQVDTEAEIHMPHAKIGKVTVERDFYYKPPSDWD